MASDVSQSANFYKLWAWFETHRQQAFLGLVGLLLAGLIVGFFFWRESEKEVAAAEALSNVSISQLASPATRAEIANAYLKVAADYPKSIAGLRAQLLAAAALFDSGKYPEALGQFEKFSREHRDSVFLGQALLGAAACLDVQGKTNEATVAYKNLVDRHPGDITVPQARFALARLYEAQGKPELARPLYEEIVRNDPFNTSLGNESAMRLEELRQKYPNLTPPPTGSPSTSFAPPSMLPQLALPPSNVPPTITATNAAPPIRVLTNTAPIILQSTSAAPIVLQPRTNPPIISLPTNAVRPKP